MTFHNSQDIDYRSLFGAQVTDKSIRLCIDVPVSTTAVTLRLWYSDGGEVLVPMLEYAKDEKKALRKFEGSFLTNSVPGWVWYYFIIEENNDGEIKHYYYGDNKKHLGGIGCIYGNDPISYQVTVYDKNIQQSNWAPDSIMYHIFVDRFNRGKQSPKLGTGLRKSQVAKSNWNGEPAYVRDEAGNVIQYDFFGGNLQGILEKLDYLKELNVNLIYLSPIMESVSNHKYDVGNYKVVDLAFGDTEGFKMLIAKAHSYGMKVILDGVFSHTGADSIYFNKENTYDSIGACQSLDSPYASWYTFDEYPDKYECWWGMTNLPNVKEETPSYMDYIIRNWDSVIRHWDNLGIDGWRLDVADELPDGFLKAFYAEVKRINPNALVLGEVWEDATRKEGYGKLREYVQGHMLDSVMNYPFRNIVIDVLTQKRTIAEGMAELKSLHENYPPHIFYSLMNLLSSHDERRILTELGEAPDMSDWTQDRRQEYRLSQEKRELAKQRLKLAIMWQMTFPGIPDIYYGDEAGLEGDTDPYNRRTYPWGNEDVEILDWYKKMANLRMKLPVLRTGSWTLIEDDAILAYTRCIIDYKDVFGKDAQNYVAYVLINPNNEKQSRTVLLPNNLDGTWKALSINGGERVLFGYEEDNDGLSFLAHDVELEANDGIIIYGKISDDEQLKSLPYKIFDKKETLKGRLLHVTSLPGEDGIGDLGKVAFDWIEYLVKENIKIWQILPITEPALANSPYTAYSAIAGDTRLIAIDLLKNNGYLSDEDIAKVGEYQYTKPYEEHPYIELESVMGRKLELYKIAFNNFKNIDDKTEFNAFCKKEETWLLPYALFKAIKSEYNNAPWYTWGELSNYQYAKTQIKKYKESIEYEMFLQWQFEYQWARLHSWANFLGIKIMGDVPFFMAYDSVEVWSHPEYFDLNEDKTRKTVAGVPPDYFAKKGQLWGNPQYRWDILAKENYAWWINNIKKLLEKVDIIRLDHFRGYESVWSISANDETAINGQWKKVPGRELFDALAKAIPKYQMQREGCSEIVFVAEDLGEITTEVNELRLDAKMPGMNVIQFCLGKNTQPLRDLSDRFIYTGTHDNNTMIAWLESVLDDEYKLLCDFVGLSNEVNTDKLSKALQDWGQKTCAKACIIPMQDILSFGSKHRMNIPGVVNGTNWLWRMPTKEELGNLETEGGAYERK